jgi:MFS family permease
MNRFLRQFPQISEHVSGAGFWKGVLGTMIELSAVLGGPLNEGWIADKISRKHSIMVVVVIFIVQSALETPIVDYAALTIAQPIGGIGTGMLSMVAPPLHISEVGQPEVRGTLEGLQHHQRNCRWLLDHRWQSVSFQATGHGGYLSGCR